MPRRRCGTEGTSPVSTVTPGDRLQIARDTSRHLAAKRVPLRAYRVRVDKRSTRVRALLVGKQHRVTAYLDVTVRERAAVGPPGATDVGKCVGPGRTPRGLGDYEPSADGRDLRYTHLIADVFRNL